MAPKKLASASKSTSKPSSSKGKTKDRTSKHESSTTTTDKRHVRHDKKVGCYSRGDAGRTHSKGDKRSQGKKGDLGTDSTGPELKGRK
jgi:hypothetical protein